MNITGKTTDTLALWLATLGVLGGVVLAVMVGVVFFRHTFHVPLYDQLYFMLLSCSGVYALVRFIVKSSRARLR